MALTHASSSIGGELVPDKVGGACVEAMVVAVRPSRAGGAGGVGRRRRRLSAVN
jgi:hypothetical protein